MCRPALDDLQRRVWLGRPAVDMRRGLDRGRRHAAKAQQSQAGPQQRPVGRQPARAEIVADEALGVQIGHLLAGEVFVFQDGRVHGVLRRVERFDLRLDLLEEFRARIRRHDVEVGERRVDCLGVAEHAADRLFGILGKTDHEAGHGTHAQRPAQRDELALLVVANRRPVIATQRVFRGGLDADSDARQADFGQRTQHVRLQKVDPPFDRKLNSLGQRADQLRQAKHPLAVDAEQRIAELERTKAVGLHAGAHLGHHAFRRAQPRGVFQNDIGAVVALQRAAAALLDQRGRKSRKIIADPELPRREGRPLGKRQQVEIARPCQRPRLVRWRSMPRRASSRVVRPRP